MTSYLGTLFDAAFFVPSVSAFEFSGLANISCQGYFILFRVSGIRGPFFYVNKVLILSLGVRLI